MNFISMSHPGSVRPNNEDYTESFQYRWCGSDGRLGAFTSLILADGMGGAAAGEYASMLAVNTVKKNLKKVIFGQSQEEVQKLDFAEFLKNSFTESNAAIYSKGNEDAEFEGMGTTLVAGVICNQILTIAHAGDSRCYLLREGRFKSITRDHSLVQELVDSGRITADQAATHPNRNVITRAIGVAPEIETECSKLPLFSGDILLLCSDGLSGYAEEGSMKKILVEKGSEPNANLKQITQDLIDLANLNGGGDNISVCLYKHLYI